MKKTFIALAIPLIMAACNNGNTAAGSASGTASGTTATSSNAAVFQFEHSTFDFGKVKEGEKVTHEYKFTNAGKSPLIITDARASCGCTIPEYPKEPIAPGKSGVIKVVFNSAGKFGKQNKVITVTSNAGTHNTELYLTGEVEEK